MAVARWLETDSNTNKDISAAVSIGAYTADADRFIVCDVSLLEVAGNGDYVAYITRQINGAGSHVVMGPKTTLAAASGETAVGFQSGMISVRSGDVITVMVDGLGGDTATPDTVVRFFEMATLRPVTADRQVTVAATGEASVNVTYLKDVALTETGAGYLAAAFKKLFDVASPVLTAASVNQTADVQTLISTVGAAGAGLTALATTAALAVVDANVDAILEDTATTLDTLIKDIPTVAELEARTLVAADYTAVSDLSGLATSSEIAALEAHGDSTWATADVSTLALETTAQSVKAKTDNLPSDPADQSEILAAIADIEAGSAPTKEEIRAEIDANSTRLAAIQLITDQLDVSAVTQVVDSRAGHLVVTIGLTFNESVSGLVIPANWAKAYWTVKDDPTESDTEAIIQLCVSNPASVTDGLLRLNSAAVASPITLASGSLAVDQSAGSINIQLADELTVLLEKAGSIKSPANSLGWDIKFVDVNGKSTGRRGTVAVVPTETKVTS